MTVIGFSVRPTTFQYALFATSLALSACRSCGRNADVEGTGGAPAATASIATEAPDAGKNRPAQPPLMRLFDSTQTWVVCVEPPDIPMLSGLGTSGGWSYCFFRGVVRELIPDSWEHRESYGRVKATRVVLDIGSSDVGCAVDRLRGEQIRFESPPPRVQEFLVVLEPGIMLPFAIGDTLCGSARGASRDGSIDLDVDYEALIATSGGEMLLAYSNGIPRDRSPFPGITFSLGKQRTFERPGVDVFDDYDVISVIDGVSTTLPVKSGFVMVETPKFRYHVRAHGWRANGPLSDRYRARDKSRYSFTIVRAAVR